MNTEQFSTENYNYYAFVVDGEVGFVMPVSKGVEHINAVFSSQAVVHLIPQEKVEDITVGWQYAAGEFLPPTE